MATSSITKEFYVKDQQVFDNLKKKLETDSKQTKVSESSSLKKGRNKLATFVFR